ncbi:LysR family transcriptional regulator [Fodinicurvata sediminis]|uniref:LysR family transcriptional regulator n=1 Tax=Fodinicurvata sediminis TaxID=1121832 RepID=UPI0003B6A05C|nr:LysR family transcriptional regulator [Fodinicurvata sediminis]
MELRTLRAFVEVVRQGSFSQAAKTIFSTQSTVSKAVKQLEDELGFVLLDRAYRSIRLTAAGRIVYQRAMTILKEREDLVEELSELQGLQRGVLRLGLPPVGSSVLFAPLFATYRAYYPSIEIQLQEHGSKRLEELVLNGELDLGASLLPVPEDFEWQHVCKEPIDALLPVQHPLSQADSVTLADLKSSPFLLFETEFAINHIIFEACERQGFTPQVAARSSQISFLVELVAAGMGIGFLPRMIAEERQHPRVSPVLVADPDFYWHIALVWRRGAYLSHAARAWLDLAAQPNRVRR